MFAERLRVRQMQIRCRAKNADDSCQRRWYKRTIYSVRIQLSDRSGDDSFNKPDIRVAVID